MKTHHSRLRVVLAYLLVAGVLLPLPGLAQERPQPSLQDCDLSKLAEKPRPRDLALMDEILTVMQNRHKEIQPLLAPEQQRKLKEILDIARADRCRCIVPDVFEEIIEWWCDYFLPKLCRYSCRLSDDPGCVLGCLARHSYCWNR